MDPSDSSLIKKRVHIMKKMKSSMAIVGHTLGFSILIKGVAHMFWNLSSVHFLKSHNSETKLMKLPDNSAWPKGRPNIKKYHFQKLLSKGSMPLPHWWYWFSRWIHLRTYPHLLLYELSSSNFFFLSYRWCFLYLLIFLYSYGLPVRHLSVIFWPNGK